MMYGRKIIDGFDLEVCTDGELLTNKKNLIKLLNKFDNICGEEVKKAIVFGGFATSYYTNKNERPTGDLDLYLPENEDKFLLENISNATNIPGHFEFPIDGIYATHKEVQPAIEVFTTSCMKDCFSTFLNTRRPILEKYSKKIKDTDSEKYYIVSKEGLTVLKIIGMYDDRYKPILGNFKDPNRHKEDILSIVKTTKNFKKYIKKVDDIIKEHIMKNELVKEKEKNFAINTWIEIKKEIYKTLDVDNKIEEETIKPIFCTCDTL